MNGITVTLRMLHRGEAHLAGELLAVADRHDAEHEIHHVATDLAGWSIRHGELLADTARHYGLDLTGTDDHPSHAPAPIPPGTDPELTGRHCDPGLVLLHDLRNLHLAACGNSLSWKMLIQTAQVIQDTALLDLATSCHPRTLRQIRWTNSMLKNLSPQILTSLER